MNLYLLFTRCRRTARRALTLLNEALLTKQKRCLRCRSSHHTDCWDPGFYRWDGKTYEKQLYDVKLLRPNARGETVVHHCWPNAGCMVTTDGSGVIYHPSEIAGVRVSATQDEVLE